MFDEFFGIEIEMMPGNPARKRSWDEEQSLAVTIRWPGSALLIVT
jgi:hypothetical protein